MADLPRGHHFKLEDYHGGRDKTFTTKAAAIAWRDAQRDKEKWELYEFTYGRGDRYRKVSLPSSPKLVKGRRV